MDEIRLIRSRSPVVDGPAPRWRARSWTWIAFLRRADGRLVRGHGWTRAGALASLAARLDD